MYSNSVEITKAKNEIEYHCNALKLETNSVSILRNEERKFL